MKNIKPHDCTVVRGRTDMTNLSDVDGGFVGGKGQKGKLRY